MEKYLFTDGTAGIVEVQSEEDLQALIRSAARPENIRIWIFNHHEWISYADFMKKRYPSAAKKPVVTPVTSPRPARNYGWLKKTLIAVLAGVAIFLIYNFTRLKWERVAPLHITAPRPANVPVLNIDSLISVLEFIRGQKIDKITKTNLRIRNNWPERILLQLDAERDTSNTGMRYRDVRITIDNATGYQVEQALVQLTAWKDNRVSATDTVRFTGISYAAPAIKTMGKIYRGDSLAVSFLYIKAPAFNFCYSSEKSSNYGNPADRWFCRE